MIDQLSEFLSDQEKEKIYQFNEDEVLQEAIRKVLLAGIYTAGSLRKDLLFNPLKNGALALGFAAVNVRAALTDEQIGQDTRALCHGLNALETAFEELKKINRVSAPVEVTENPAI